ncbi:MULTISPECIES: phosphoribosylanthranilate isomerase [Nostocales]|uniref:N-(5'-phosphoribosyl)anthranilate isomerase n=3 Tax=Nostocales TaxID=1161 RepID=A0A0C1N0Z5_9CYAN|nr:phosphoribosylanthranilate isomerase [Tolypothrix bouteillei]KAF3885853.1 phosphoribosylanthranilate isomerase [Tolypothrix bouteillei VB521301]
MRIKICGITQPEQGKTIASLGATALGFMCVPSSPRYVNVEQIRAVVEQLPENVDKIGVFANASLEEIKQTVLDSGLTGAQLHGDESPEFVLQLREYLPDVEILKALRIRGTEDLEKVSSYTNYVDTVLLDAYHPQQLGGTGITLDWAMLEQFSPGCPWFLAGGLTPDNILDALNQVHPNGIDLSSGVERAPGDKDLDKVAKLFEKLKVVSS